MEVANRIHEFGRKNVSNGVTRVKVEELLFEMSHKLLVNKNFMDVVLPDLGVKFGSGCIDERLGRGERALVGADRLGIKIRMF